MEHLSNDHKDHSNQQENSHKQCDEMGHPVLLWIYPNGKSMETETIWSEFANEGKAIVEQINEK